MKYLMNSKGFTMLEMTIVVAIIGVLLFMAIPNYRSVAETAQEKSCEMNRKMIAAQADHYMIEKSLPLPEDLESTPENEPIEELVQAKFLKEIPKCPSGGNYIVHVDENPIRVTCDVHN